MGYGRLKTYATQHLCVRSFTLDSIYSHIVIRLGRMVWPTKVSDNRSHMLGKFVRVFTLRLFTGNVPAL